jgi:hypothetical protein
MKYEKLDLEAFPPKQKLRMLQNAVGDVTELSYIKQIGDQDIARGNPPLSYDSYMGLLLSACSTYYKKVTLPGSDMISTVFDLCTVLTSQRILLFRRNITKYWYKRRHATPHLQLSRHVALHLPVYGIYRCR